MKKIFCKQVESGDPYFIHFSVVRMDYFSRPAEFYAISLIFAKSQINENNATRLMHRMDFG